MELNQRKKMILKAIVEDYIVSAEPVSSKNIIENYPLHLSAATVRNVMAELENDGYLQQPHISAGRIPSDKAYRTYVDRLIEIPEIQPQVKQEIESAMEDEFNQLESAVKKATELMTRSTGYTSVAFSPRIAKSIVSQIKLLMIEPGKVLVVLVLNPGIVKDRLINISPEICYEDLQILAEAIERGLAGKKLEDITWITVESVARGLKLPDNLLNQILFEAYLAIKQSDNLDTYLEGMQKLLDHPEFHNPGKARTVLDFLTRDGFLAGYLAETMQETGVNEVAEESELFPAVKQPKFMIRIGQEIALPGFEDCSFVTTTYSINDSLSGQIGIIGPKRMNYREVIANVGFIRQIFNNKISKNDER